MIAVPLGIYHTVTIVACGSEGVKLNSNVSVFFRKGSLFSFQKVSVFPKILFLDLVNTDGLCDGLLVGMSQSPWVHSKGRGSISKIVHLTLST